MNRVSASGSIGAAVAAAVMLAAGGASASVSRTPVPVPAAIADTNVFNCTPAGPMQLCVGVNYSGSMIDSVQAQVKIPAYDNEVAYGLGGPSGWSASGGPFAGGPGWVTPPLIVQVGKALGAGSYCAEVAADGQILSTCVDVP